MKRRFALLLAVVPFAALALAGQGAAAPAGSSDLAIVNADSPDPVAVGSPLAYAIQVSSKGPASASGVVVTDSLPKGADFVSAVPSAGTCRAKGKTVTCELGSVSAPAGVDYGAPPTVTVTVIPRRVGTISSTASVKGNQKDPVGSNNSATATTLVVGAATCRGVPATVVGTPGADTLTGTSEPDVIAALGGDDIVISSEGRDLVCAGGGADLVAAGSAADRVFGGAGRDRLLGRGGPDVLKAGAGNDVLRGNRGADRLRGQAGRDRCRGGAGRDSIRGCEL
jgi:uncharacterized repeat protein (TIGR01451 family)